MSATTTTSTHEAEIRSLGTKARVNQVPGRCKTNFTFAIPSSLAFFKRLTWEQTPWTLNPISASKARIISSYTFLPVDALQNALPLGVSYTGESNAEKKQYPHLYVVFHRLRRNITRDPKFLEFWHDEVVKPAFDLAWEESGLVEVHGMPSDVRGTSGRWGEGTWTQCNADPASHFFELLCGDRNKSVHTAWPEYSDAWEGGQEGQFSDIRAKLFDEAWTAMKGMVSGYAAELQDPLLLAVWDTEASCDDAAEMVEGMGCLWDVYADSRFVNDKWFTVHLDQVVEKFQDHEVEN
jgi:hypothetical protein